MKVPLAKATFSVKHVVLFSVFPASSATVGSHCAMFYKFDSVSDVLLCPMILQSS